MGYLYKTVAKWLYYANAVLKVTKYSVRGRLQMI